MKYRKEKRGSTGWLNSYKNIIIDRIGEVKLIISKRKRDGGTKYIIN